MGRKHMSTCARPRRWLCLALSMLVLAACGAEQKQAPETDPLPGAKTASNTTPAPVAPPPPAVTQASWAPDALEELLAPIALYPDQLLTQILAASVNTQEVLDGGNWLLDHQSLQGEALDAAARQAGFGAAMRALLQFPTVVDMLCQQIDWTRQVGSAFSSDQKSVLDAVQRLRLQAAQVGNLQSTPQQTVETRTESTQTIIEVKPADPQIVYVPQYNPQVVYTTPPQPAPATTTTSDDTVSTETAVAAGLIGFGVGALIGSAMDDDDDYCCHANWGHSTVVVGTRSFYPPAYAYRPAYGAGFRPAYGYNPPAGYRHNSGNYQRGRQGNTTNIDVDNSNYFNRFSNNQNLRAGTAQSPLGTGGAGAHRIKPTEGGRTENWKGQSTYRGARDDATTQRLNQSAGERGMSERAHAQSEGRRTAASSGGASYSGERAGRGAQTDNRPARSANIDRGYGEGPSLESHRANVQRSAPEIQRPASDTPRSVPDIQRPETSMQRTDTAAAGVQERPRDSAFSGARDSGSFERSASARGRASGGGRGGGRRR